jgi:two-component system response regulator VicR
VEKRRILCIEDQPEMIELIRLVLRRHGFQVDGAVGGREGLRMVRENPPDLVLLDLMMPEVDGWEVYRQIRADERLREIPVIAVTAKGRDVDRVVGVQVAGMNDFITKPFGLDDLVTRVQRALDEARQ